MSFEEMHEKFRELLDSVNPDQLAVVALNLPERQIILGLVPGPLTVKQATILVTSVDQLLMSLVPAVTGQSFSDQARREIHFGPEFESNDGVN